MAFDVTPLNEAYDQGSLPACSSFAVAGFGDYILKKAGINDTIDPYKLYEETDGVFGGAGYTKIFEFGFKTGLLGKSGRRYTFKDAGFAYPSMTLIEEAFAKHRLLLIEYHLCDYDPFNNRIVNGKLSRQPADSHSMLIRGLDKENRESLVRNSAGPEWQIRGDFIIPYTLLRSPYLERVAWFTLNV